MSDKTIFINKERMKTDRVYDNGTFKIGENVILEPYCMIYPGCIIGDNCIIGSHAVLKDKTIVGHNSIIGTLTATEGNCSIGNYTTIHSQCHITEGLFIGNNVFIAPFFLCTNTPKISKGKFGYPNTTHDPRLKSFIKDGVRIGGNVSLAPGITIGENAVIDMCCLIAKDVPANSHMRALGGYVAREYSDKKQ